MNRPNLVRSIFAELQEVAGDIATPAELLRLASTMVEATDPDDACSGSELSDRKGGVPFDLWALDRAMADGGWRVLRHESELGTPVFGDESEAFEGEDIAIRDWMMENAA